MRWRQLAVTGLVSIAAGLVTVLLPLPETALWLRLGVQAVVFAAAFLGLMLGFGLFQPDERELLRAPFSRLGGGRGPADRD